VKSEFCHAHVVFLVDQGQAALVVAKVQKYPVPNDKQDLMRLLGVAGYHCKFCHNLAAIALPLTALLLKSRNLSAFDRSQYCRWLQLLVVPNFSKPLKLFIDACDIGMDGVLLQEDIQNTDHSVC